MIRSALAILLSLTVLVGGCGQRYVTPERLDQGLVVVLSGIEGRSLLNESICDGLDRGGVEMAIENYEWAPRMGLVATLWDQKRNRASARKLAARIERYLREYPDRPVYLVGQSGGAAAAVWGLEALGDDLKVDGVVLLAAALSPEYPLTEALHKSRSGLVNFYSRQDWLILDLGTRMAGTMDGKRTASAGNVGFELPGDLSLAAPYTHAYQVPWRADMLATGHVGGHMSSSAPAFIRRYVAPLLQSPRWNAYLLSSIAGQDVQAMIPAPANHTGVRTLHERYGVKVDYVHPPDTPGQDDAPRRP